MEDYKDLRIVFMGTPDFAVASLEALLNAGCNIVGVITSPDKPGGRGMQLQQSAVKQFAVQHKLSVLQPEKFRDENFQKELKALKADLQIVVAFRMLPEVVWKMPSMGTINLHGSLLPQYRGAAPINRAIMNGENETGVTTFLLQQEIDTGKILLQEKIAIRENETAGELHDKMKTVGANVVVETVKQLVAGTIKPMPQSEIKEEALHSAPKIFTTDCEINWNQPASEIFNFIRGLSPYPAAFTFLDGKKLKIFQAEKTVRASSLSPGMYDSDSKSFLGFCCADFFLAIKELQLEGKKKMTIEEFLRGYRFN